MTDNNEETPKPSGGRFVSYRPKLVDKDPFPDFDEDADPQSQLLLLRAWQMRNPDKSKPGTPHGDILAVLEELLSISMCMQDIPGGFGHVCDN